MKTEEMQKVSILRLQDEFYRLEAEERKAITNSDLINAAVLKAEKEKSTESDQTHKGTEE